MRLLSPAIACMFWCATTLTAEAANGIGASIVQITP